MSRRPERRPPRKPVKKKGGRHRALPRSRFQRFLLRWGWLLPVGAILLGGALLVLTYAFASIPLPKDLEIPSSAQVFDRNGKLIGEYAGDQRRFLIDTTKLPQHVKDAVISAEDRDFYKHSGVSVRGILRAAWADLTGGEITQGGSTITQQYVKNAVLQDPSRTIARKAKEVILAVKLERRYSKDEILGFYLNTIYFGRGAYGIEAAAMAYFDKKAANLELDEAAFLAGIIPAPESYQPDDNAQGARTRRDLVLDAMVEEGYISEDRAAVAKRGKVKAKEYEGGAKELEAAYFMEWLRKEYLYPKYGEGLYTRGLKIYTTLDLGLQEAAEGAIDEILPNREDPQAALVSITPDGAVRAMVGGRDFNNAKAARGFNFATTYPGRQPGSAFKPFTLLAAIEEGISPTSTFSGHSPMTIEDPACAGTDGLWEVDNFGGSSYGTLTLEDATTNSVNTVYAQLVSEVGPEKVAEVLETLEFAPKYGEKEISPDCSNALGGSLLATPLEMGHAYAGLTARGDLPEIMPLIYVEDSNGICLDQYRPVSEDLGNPDCEKEHGLKSEQVVEENSADVLNQVMTSVVSGGTATAADIGRPVAGKTGTTQDNKDAWFAGSVPQLTTVVWMGYPVENPGTKKEVQPLMQSCTVPPPKTTCRPVQGLAEVTGGSFPAQIWAAYMSVATADMEIAEFPVPEDLPDEIINSPSPAPVVTFSPEPEVSRTPEPEPTEVEPSPTPEPPPTTPPPPPPTVEPTVEPTVQPSPTTRGRDP